MTAEIAILNKSAIALAADSAGTIGQGGAAKIYNGFNKIFELSAHHPVGIMIYGNLDFMGLPLESLIKRYRRQLGRAEFTSVSGYLNDFLRFLRDDIPASDDDVLRNAFGILSAYYADLAKRAESVVFAELRKVGKYLPTKVNQSISEVISGEISVRKDEELIPGFHSKLPPGAALSWNPVIEQAYGMYFDKYGLNKAVKSQLLKCGQLILLKGPLSIGRTGIVVAGFGSADYCPSLESIEIDGKVLGKLKYTQAPGIDIGRSGPHADMVGFAQDDMVSTFLNGVDPRYEEYVDTSLDKLFSGIIAAPGANAALPPGALTALNSFFGQVRQELTSKLLEFRTKTFKTPIIDMIRFMPTQELATLAASMIEITSLKRRVTKERETVGGDIDVAVISRAEGFVWIKRKHYFPADLNPRFFNRLHHDPTEADHERR